MKSIEKVERPWGRFYVIHDENSYKLKRIEVEPGKRLSYQYHSKRDEAWTIVEGEGLITIDEIYSIGPSISVLMDGYVQKDGLVSLRGTLVPATTINKAIGSIPLLGDILVGKKVGEGVFGVSFKIKGYPKDLKTSVNPIKTLTPRFITRTLEKIKKAN